MKPFLSKTYRDKICMVLRIYREIEKRTEVLKQSTGLKCPDGCGFCCLSHNIEASPIEFYPLAFYLFTINIQDKVLKMISDKHDENICVFFSKENYSANKWSCTMHKLRPLVCRLFGFYGIKDKSGQTFFSSCKIIKLKYPEEYKCAFLFIKEIAPFMCMYNYYLKINSIGNDFENKLMPINKALKIATETIGFEISKGFWCNNFPKKLR